MSYHPTSSRKEASLADDKSEPRRARRGKIDTLTAANVVHDRQHHRHGGPPQHDTRLRQRSTDREEHVQTEVDSCSEHDFSKLDDHATPFSATELADVIMKSGREAGLSTALCSTCKSIAGWFFLDRHTWERASAGCSFVTLRAVSGANPADACSLCSFLGRVAQSLRVSGLPEGPQGYQLRATGTAPAFNHSRYYSAPAFCVSPSGPDSKAFEVRHRNAYFAQNSRRRGCESLSARQIGPYWDPAIIRQWIAFCDAQHQSRHFSSTGEKVSIPYFCVIDCSTIPPFLVEAQPRDSLEYTTLSYVWGQEPCEGPGEDDRLPSRLPELIQGAICVTLALGYRHLWIDRYCVPQNDPIRKGSLINNMDKIYEYSVFCIVAAAARKPSDGLHGITRPREVKQESMNLGSVSFSQMMTNIHDEVRTSHWNSRGWTYQERVLATRRLVFTATQCCFQCGEQWFLETLDYPMRYFDRFIIPSPFPNWEKFAQDACRQAFEVLAPEYSRRQLTNGSDSVPAIKGILNIFQCCVHIAGIPVFDPVFSGMPLVGALLESLAWLFLAEDHPGMTFKLEGHTGRPSGRKALDKLPLHRPGAPSWTWCAWECGSTPYLPSWKESGRTPLWSMSWEESLQSWGGDRIDFLTTTSVSVEDAQGKIAQWSGPTLDVIAQKLSTLSDVKYLRVRGWVCDVAIPDTSQHTQRQLIFNGPTYVSYYTFDNSLPRLNALARQRQMRSVDGWFIFSGWVVSIAQRWEGGDFEIGTVMLLSGTPNGSHDVERLDMCRVRFETLPNLSPDNGSFLTSLGWVLRSFRIA